MSRHTRKGQTALEFMVLMGFMLFVFTAFFYVIQERSTIAAVQSRYAELRAVSEIITNEVTTASRVRDGYSRTFELPTNLKTGTYTVTLILESELVITTTDEEYLVFLPVNITAPSGIATGRNIITKKNGIITIIPAPETAPPACMPSQTLCGSVCKNTQTDVSNCGSCGHSCMPINCGTFPTCSAGACTYNCVQGENAFGVCVGSTSCATPSYSAAQNKCILTTKPNGSPCGTAANPGTCMNGVCETGEL